MKQLLVRLRTFVKHPITQLVMGLILLVSGGWEIVLDFRSAEQSFRFGVHHGVALFGLIQIIGSLPEMVEGFDRTFEAIEKQRRE